MPSKAPGFHVLKGQIRPFKPRGLAGVLLPSPDNDVAIERIELDCPAMPPGLLGGDDRRAVAGKRIEDDGTAPGHIPDRVGNERRRLHCGMQGMILGPARPETGDPRIVPDVGAGPAVPTQLEDVGVRRVAVLEHEHKLVAGAVEAAHRRAIFRPYDEVLKRKPHFTACRHQAVEVLPIGEHEQDGSILRVFLAALQESREKRDELVFRYFGGCRRDVRLADAAGAIALDRNVAWRIGQDDIRLLFLEQKLVAGQVTCIPTQEAVLPKHPQIARP